MTVHPAFQLLAITGFGLSAILAGVSWSTLSARRDSWSGYWHAGLMAISLAIAATAVFGRASILSNSALVASALFCLISLHGERTGKLLLRRAWLPVLLAFVCLQVACDLLGAWLTWGVLLTNATMALLYGVLLAEVRGLWRQCHGRGLLVIALGLALPGVVFVVRAVRMLDGSASPTLFSASPLTNAAVVSIFVGLVLNMTGYLIFALEKTHRQMLDDARAIATAQERGRLAQQHAAAMQQLVSERDHMILASSRFSAANSLAVFNSAIVHEISQPLQALRTQIDVLAMRGTAAGPEGEANLAPMRRLVDTLANTLSNLRRLLGNQQPEREDVDVGVVLAGVMPIVRSETERRGIALELGAGALDAGRVVLCNRILFERLLFNLFSNAIEALDGQPADHQRRIRLCVGVHEDAGTPRLTISVEDTGPGFPAPLLANPGSLFHTTKAQGLGLGLSLVRIIAESWRGTLTLRNCEPADDCGACAVLDFPLIAGSAAEPGLAAARAA